MNTPCKHLSIMRAVALMCAVLLGAIACTEQGSAENAALGEGEIKEGQFALLTLTADTGHSPRVGDEIEVTGQFVTYTGPSAEWAMRALDLWVPDDDRLQWRDRCELDLDAANASFDRQGYEATRIELMEAGHIELSSQQQSTLELHHVPDLMDFFSGVVYRLGEGHGFEYSPEKMFRFSGSGGEHIGAFDVTLYTPDAMELLTIAGAPRGNSLDVEAPVNADLALEWIPGSLDEGRVHFDLYNDVHSPSALLSCTVDDDGAFALPQEAVAALRRAYPEASFRVVARRAEIVDFPLEGVEWAQAAFITSDVFFLTP